LYTTYKILPNILLTRVTAHVEEIIGEHHCGFGRNRSTTDHIFCICHISEKNWNTIRQLFIDCKKAYDKVRREVFYNILIEFGMPMKLVRLINLCLCETYSRVRVGIHLSDMSTFKNGLKKGLFCRHCFSTLFRICHLESAGETGGLGINGYTSSSRSC
jgi:hypothetical protein